MGGSRFDTMQRAVERVINEGYPMSALLSQLHDDTLKRGNLSDTNKALICEKVCVYMCMCMYVHECVCACVYVHVCGCMCIRVRIRTLLTLLTRTHTVGLCGSRPSRRLFRSAAAAGRGILHHAAPVPRGRGLVCGCAGSRPLGWLQVTAGDCR